MTEDAPETEQGRAPGSVLNTLANVLLWLAVVELVVCFAASPGSSRTANALGSGFVMLGGVKAFFAKALAASISDVSRTRGFVTAITIAMLCGAGLLLGLQGLNLVAGLLRAQG